MRAVSCVEPVLHVAQRVYPPHWPFLASLYRECALLLKKHGDVAKMNEFIDMFNDARRICMGPRCALKACVPRAGCLVTPLQTCNRFLQAESMCGACKTALYCSRECQLGHWRAGHKAECAGHKGAI